MRALLLASMLATLLPAGCDDGPKVDPAAAEAKLASDLEAAAAWTRNHKFKDAEKVYETILAQDSEQPEALAGLARIRFSDGQPDEALVLVDRAVAAKADDAATHSLRGEVLARKEQHAEAAAAFAKAAALDPDKSEYSLPQGVQLKLAKQYDEAEKVLRGVVELDPMAQFVYTELGDVLRGQGRDDEALKTYMKALSTWASDKMAHAGAAQVYESKGDVDHALTEWSTYVRMDCCSAYSDDVAKTRIVALQAASNTRNVDAPPADAPPPAVAE